MTEDADRTEILTIDMTAEEHAQAAALAAAMGMTLEELSRTTLNAAVHGALPVAGPREPQ